MSEIQTYTKIMFDPLRPDPDKIRIADIAHALSMLCRAGGHFQDFYSVGQHCINCTKEAAARGYSQRVQLGCLLHDASEAYIADVTRPVKAALPAYLEIEAPLQDAIWNKWLGAPLSEEEKKQIFEIDDAILEHEFLVLADTKFQETLPVLLSSPDFTFSGFSQTEAEFLNRFHSLTALCNQAQVTEVTVAQMKQIEHDADAKGLSYLQMMENAGQGAAKLLLQKCPKSLNTAAVFCGTGNNGGDGFVLARALREAGKQVHIFLVGGSPKTADACHNFEKAQALHIPMEDAENLSQDAVNWILNADAVIDALYGTGFHGQLRPAGKTACGLMNRSRGFCLALDLPSGLSADSGIAAEGAVQADMTAAFHAFKPCHRLNPGQCGKTEIVSIGAENIL